MKTILCSVSFLFFIESTALVWSQPLSMLLLRVNKAAKRAQIKFRLQPSFYDKALQSYKKFRTNTSIIFSFFHVFFGSLMSNSARLILTADG